MNTNIILFCNFNQVRILLHIVSEHTSEENNFIQVRVAKRQFRIKRSKKCLWSFSIVITLGGCKTSHIITTVGSRVISGGARWC